MMTSSKLSIAMDAATNEAFCLWSCKTGKCAHDCNENGTCGELDEFVKIKHEVVIKIQSNKTK